MNKEHFQIYASIAEVVSAVAIIVSLFYVGYELRRAETLSSNEVDTILFERVREMNGMLIENRDLAELVLLARKDPAGLSEVDRLRYLAYQHVFFDSWEVAWIYHEDEVLEDATWLEWDEWFASEAKRRPVFGWVENRPNFTGSEFRRHVDEVLGIE